MRLSCDGSQHIGEQSQVERQTHDGVSDADGERRIDVRHVASHDVDIVLIAGTVGQPQEDHRCNGGDNQEQPGGRVDTVDHQRQTGKRECDPQRRQVPSQAHQVRLRHAEQVTQHIAVAGAQRGESLRCNVRLADQTVSKDFRHGAPIGGWRQRLAAQRNAGVARRGGTSSRYADEMIDPSGERIDIRGSCNRRPDIPLEDQTRALRAGQLRRRQAGGQRGDGRRRQDLRADKVHIPSQHNDDNRSDQAQRAAQPHKQRHKTSDQIQTTHCDQGNNDQDDDEEFGADTGPVERRIGSRRHPGDRRAGLHRQARAGTQQVDLAQRRGEKRQRQGCGERKILQTGEERIEEIGARQEHDLQSGVEQHRPGARQQRSMQQRPATCKPDEDQVERQRSHNQEELDARQGELSKCQPGEKGVEGGRWKVEGGTLRVEG